MGERRTQWDFQVAFLRVDEARDGANGRADSTGVFC